MVCKVCIELESHLLFVDKALAHFLTEIGRKYTTVDEFEAKLKGNGVEMLDCFIHNLLKIIHIILAPNVKCKSDKDDSVKKEKKEEARRSVVVQRSKAKSELIEIRWRRSVKPDLVAFFISSERDWKMLAFYFRSGRNLVVSEMIL
ncbi:unnamed protein product [Lactuca saligna]|uniref:Uncharacterized protein n=1 Tax=Lactuca saligna TaxID=75948 RepID=A0AA35V756_LACSI|nr:unnamed protein product [Lactuca saligna]